MSETSIRQRANALCVSVGTRLRPNLILPLWSRRGWKMSGGRLNGRQFAPHITFISRFYDRSETHLSVSNGNSDNRSGCNTMWHTKHTQVNVCPLSFSLSLCEGRVKALASHVLIYNALLSHCANSPLIPGLWLFHTTLSLHRSSLLLL